MKRLNHTSEKGDQLSKPINIGNIYIPASDLLENYYCFYRKGVQELLTPPPQLVLEFI